MSARPFSFRAPLPLTACQATSGNVKESVFKHRLKIHHFSLMYLNPCPDPEPCPLSRLPGFYEAALSHLICFCLSCVIYLFVYSLKWVCFTVVKLAESTLLNTLQIPVKFKCELWVCVLLVVGVLIYTCILGSLDKLGGVLSTILQWKINWYLAIITIITCRTKVLASVHWAVTVPTVSSLRMTGNWNWYQGKHGKHSLHDYHRVVWIFG